MYKDLYIDCKALNEYHDCKMFSANSERALTVRELKILRENERI